MHSPTIQEKMKILMDKSTASSFIVSLCKTVLICGLILYLISIILLNHPNCPSTEFLSPFKLTFSSSDKSNLIPSSPTNINHLMFGLLGSAGAWKHRKSYIESWWRPNVTHGYIYLDTSPTEDLLPWPSSSPPFRVSEDNTRFIEESKHVAPIMVRMVRGIIEVMREKREGLRWLVMGDDDSIFFVDNLVDVLATYDHTKYIYIGGHSEFILSNFHFSFDTGFGGAGFIFSYPLAEAMVVSLDECMKRYPFLRSADQITMTCVADFGVDLTSNKGIHQVDLRGDISGFLFGHPQSPLVSLHHFDMVEPIFPSLNRSESARRLVKVAASLDQSRMLQQTICYDKQRNWSIAISWGYSSHIYENIFPRSFLKKRIETFGPWYRAKPPYYMFDTRWPNNDDPCRAPHVFYFQSIDRKITTTLQGEQDDDPMILTTYVRSSPRGLSPCSFTGNHSADYISTIQVLSPSTKRNKVGRSECCDISDVDDKTNTAKVKYRSCELDEIIA